MLKSKNKVAHIDRKQSGMGDWYGSGIRNKVGRIRDVHSIMPIPEKTNVPPKKLA